MKPKPSIHFIIFTSLYDTTYYLTNNTLKNLYIILSRFKGKIIEINNIKLVPVSTVFTNITLLAYLRNDLLRFKENQFSFWTQAIIDKTTYFFLMVKIFVIIITNM